MRERELRPTKFPLLTWKRKSLTKPKIHCVPSAPAKGRLSPWSAYPAAYRNGPVPVVRSPVEVRYPPFFVAA